jgi:CBS domain-containing protein/sporulation protein YlmC with PRC-barrel domain
MNGSANELFLSSVLGKTVIDERGRELGKLRDLIMVPGEIFPEVSRLIISKGKALSSLQWGSVSLFNPYVISTRSDAFPLEEYVTQDDDILIRRDILDKQIVDVNGAKVVRVNDLKLGSHEGRLCVVSVDVGFNGLARRMGYESLCSRIAGFLGRRIPHQEISWEYVQPLEMNASSLTLIVARDQLADMHPADIAQIISNIPSRNIQTVLTSLDTETAGEAIHELEPELRSRVISQLDTGQATEILEEMAPDEAADVLGDLPEEKAQELLELMDDDEAEDIQELMEHEEDTAGGLMNSEYLHISPDLTVEDTLREVRLLAPEIETVYYIYVLDGDGVPQGVVSLRDLLINPPSTPISEIMTTNLKTVRVDAEPDDILEIIAKYNLIAVPVLDEDCRMAGIVTVDDILEMFLPTALRRRRHRHH